MKIVFDTNVIYSALRSKRGASYKLISKLPSKKYQIFLSVPLYAEYQAVLLKGSLLKIFKKEEIFGFLKYFCKISVHKEIFYLWRPISKDPKDDMIIELAIAGDCDYIVTHNTKDFAGLDQFKPKAITPKEFIKLLGDKI